MTRIEYTKKGKLDEVCVDGGAHLERTRKNAYFISFDRMDGSSFCVWIEGKVIMTEERPAPASGNPWPTPEEAQ